MASANVHEFTEANFEASVLQADKPVMVDFWAEWCGPCRNLSPVIDALAADFQGKAIVGKVDTDKNTHLAVKYGITAIPTILVFKGGQVVKKLSGFQRKDSLASALEEAGAK